MRLILDKTKQGTMTGTYLIVNLPFEQCEVIVSYDRSQSCYCLFVNFERQTHYLFSNSDKQIVLNEYEKLLQAFYNGDKYYTYTWK